MMRLVPRLFRNTVFRLSLVAAALFAISSFIILAYVYAATTGAELKQVEDDTEQELSQLARFRADTNDSDLNQKIIYLSLGTSDALYVLQRGSDVTGNLNAVPEAAVSGGKTFSFQYQRYNDETGGVEPREAMGRYSELDGDTHLMVARDVTEIRRTADLVIRAIWVSAGIALALGILSGVFVASRFAKRIDGFNEVAQAVRGGELSRRLKLNESGDELDNLAGHLNAMLDHLEQLVDAMRHAGDAIAHDLRSPLTRLRTRLETAISTTDDPAAQDELAASAEDAAEILNTFEAVLRIARLEAGERRQSLTRMDPEPVLADVAELYEPVCEDVQQSFTYELESGLAIRADRMLLSQAVSNLIDNAIKYSPSGGAISLTLGRTKGGRVAVTVTDSGPGIPEKDRERVKRRFVRLDSSRNAPGSGLGLSFVKAVADMHGADFILSAPEDEDKTGLVATIIFPAAGPEKRRNAGRAEAKPA